MTSLNFEQKNAVYTNNSAVLILSGAGTGKTRVLVERFHHLLEQSYDMKNIMLVTFTNKAAEVMKQRCQVDNLAWIGTFHSLCLRILRSHASVLGYENFSIITPYEQSKLIWNIIKNDSSFSAFANYARNYFIPFISYYKNSGAKNITLSEEIDKNTFIRLYEKYQIVMKQQNLVDFDDIIILTIKLMKKNSDILNNYQKKFQHILVDEYQDTNEIQNTFLILLKGENNHIFCVGDEDQSIYSWRGANINNILNFKKIFPSSAVMRLEHNYRSTQNILNIANKIIVHNKHRLGKILKTDKGLGEATEIKEFYDDYQQAEFIAQNITEDTGILLRTANESRVLEEVFKRKKVAYVMVGSQSFYKKAEVIDLIAYIKLVYNTNDNLAWNHIINTPRRRIGDKLQEMIMNYGNEKSLFENGVSLLKEKQLSGQNHEIIEGFINKIYEWQRITSPLKLIETIVRDIDYYNYISKKDNTEDRKNNVKEFINSAHNVKTLEEFIDNLSLFSTQDDNSHSVQIMTIHAAKGREFEQVFLPGWEKDNMPHINATRENDVLKIEEERRLAYVAITRARKKLFISYTLNKFVNGHKYHCFPSMFLKEIGYKPAKKVLINSAEKKDQYICGDRVSHKIFGRGVVLENTNTGVKIMFQDRVRTIMPAYLEQ